MPLPSQFLTQADEQDLCMAVQLGDTPQALKLATIIFSKESMAHPGELEVLRSEIIVVIGLLTRYAISINASLERFMELRNRYLRELLAASDGDGVREALMGFVGDLAEVHAAAKDPAVRIRQCAERIKAYPADSGQLEELAKRYFMSRYHFSRLFKRHTGLSFKHYVVVTRITQSKELLAKQPNLSVQEVARRVGFQDGQYFSRVFKQWEGLSPGEYRRSVTSY